jgi:CheY-like chemotaxis protein
MIDVQGRLEIERDQQGRVAAAAERARIAREMHDIVAHNLAVVIALADGAVFAAGESPEQVTAAMETVSRTGREALAEMRRLLGVLNDESPSSRVPQPGIPELEQLVAQVRTTGVPVDLEVEGDPAGLPAGVQLATYRIVQEALTNTLRHAGPDAAADVRVLCVNGTVEVDVNDDGRGGSAGLGGRGLDGMRQRAAVFGGTRRLAPDAVLMDVRMPGMDGIEATRLIVEQGLSSRVLILTTFDLDEYAHAALRAGASGFLLKDALPNDLLSGIRAVASGDAVVAPSVTRRLLDTLRPPAVAGRRARPRALPRGADTGRAGPVQQRDRGRPAPDGGDGQDPRRQAGQAGHARAREDQPRGPFGPGASVGSLGGFCEAVSGASPTEITAYFWVIKVLTTGMGETTSDFLVHRLGPLPAVLIGAAAFSAALWLQLRAGRYSTWIYWLAVAMVGVFGTMAAACCTWAWGLPTSCRPRSMRSS